MDSNKKHIHPDFYTIHHAWNKECNELGIFMSGTNWQEFIKKCGLQHISMSRLEVVDEQKWMLAKIKYGI